MVRRTRQALLPIPRHANSDATKQTTAGTTIATCSAATSEACSASDTPLHSNSSSAMPAPPTERIDCARIASSAATAAGLVNGCGRRTSQRSSVSRPAATASTTTAPATRAAGEGVEKLSGYGTTPTRIVPAAAAPARARWPMSARRAAGLARRDLDQDLPRLALLGQRALASAAAAGTVLVGVVPYPDSFSTPSPAALVAGAVVVLALAAGLEALERWLVRRPQPFTSPAAVAADDAIRAQSIRSVAGAGLALLLLLCSGVSLALQASDVAALQVAMVVPAAVCFVASLFACRGIGVRAWRVRRTIGAAA